MSLVPKSQRAWALSFCRPLLVGCVLVWTIVILCHGYGGNYWRYAEPHVYLALVVLGLLLAASCLLDPPMRLVPRLAVEVIAAVSVVAGIIGFELMPMRF
jgi:hypothetical protein